MRNTISRKACAGSIQSASHWAQIVSCWSLTGPRVSNSRSRQQDTASDLEGRIVPPHPLTYAGTERPVMVNVVLEGDRFWLEIEGRDKFCDGAFKSQLKITLVQSGPCLRSRAGTRLAEGACDLPLPKFPNF